MKTRIAILASGTGSNARKITEYFKDSATTEVALIASNNKTSGVLTIAADKNIPSRILTKESFYESNSFLNELKNLKIDFIILAGFLLKIPDNFVQAYPQKIINIHPALLPKYGGKGMYGHFVHEAVFNAKEPESGITVHFVNENYDEGNIIFQASVPIAPEDNPSNIEQKVRRLELEYFAPVIESVLAGKNYTF